MSAFGPLILDYCSDMAVAFQEIDGPAGVIRLYTAGSAKPGRPIVVLCHELPRVAAAASELDGAYPDLCERLAAECDCFVAVGMLRGTANSSGDFSAPGWLADLRVVIDHVATLAAPLWLVGFGLGGAFALREAVDDERVSGVASIAGPADLTEWLADPSSVLQRCRKSGVIKTNGFPSDEREWAAQVVGLAPLKAAEELDGRPLLVMHGSEDAELAVGAARALAASATSGSAELRIVPGAGHWLRADPRVVASLIGWIERHS